MLSINTEIPIKNFRQINNWLYRGGQPNLRGVAALKEMQIKTVVTLRWQKKPISTEREQVTKLGMNFVSIPLNYWSFPPQSSIDQFLAVIDNKDNHPIFVHCFHGADRTGLLIAIFRIFRCGWGLKDAYQEMVECGFHRFRVHHFKWALHRIARQIEAKNR